MILLINVLDERRKIGFGLNIRKKNVNKIYFSANLLFLILMANF